jgi:hypothetical protein
MGRIRDTGELSIRILEDEQLRMQARRIYHDFEQDQGYELLVSQEEDDDYHDYYYAFDDDTARNPVNAWDDPTIQDEKHCRRTSWHRDLPINCNSLHEFDVHTRFRLGDARFLG